MGGQHDGFGANCFGHHRVNCHSCNGEDLHLMPFVSKKQMRWGNSHAGVKALGGPAKVAEWDSASKGLKLPASKPVGILGRVKKPRKTW